MCPRVSSTGNELYVAAYAMMQPAGEPSSVVRFGVFEADLRVRELRKQGLRVRLAEQPFQVLALLLAEPGRLVTRDELQERLWPADTLVDFDRGLNKAINRVREALGDSAESPRFIETLPKRGHRFVASVHPAGVAPGATIVAEQEAHTASAGQGWRTPLLAAVVLALTAVTGYHLRWRPMQSAPLVPVAAPLRASLLPPTGLSFVAQGIALSPTGRGLAFVAETAEGMRSLWVRDLSTGTARPIAGTADASHPFWSPTERELAFFADRRLQVVELASGGVRALADVRRPSGGSWGADGTIVYAPDVYGPLYRLSAGGDGASLASELQDSDGSRGHRWPYFLPDGRRFLFVGLSGAAPNEDSPELRVGSLDSLHSMPVEWPGARAAVYAGGRLWFARAGVLYAQAFDADRARLEGRPIAITAREVAGPQLFYPPGFAVSPTGTIVFQSSNEQPASLLWLDGAGREPGRPRVLPRLRSPALSRDGRWLAGSCDGPSSDTVSICVHDLVRGVTTRLTDGPNDRCPVWSPDGGQLAFLATDGLFVVATDGGAAPRRLSDDGIPTSWTDDGHILVFGIRRQAVALAMVAAADGAVTPVGPGAEGQLSRRGDWLAYLTREGLVVQRFPAGVPRIQVTDRGASQPRWSADGRHLFYIAADKKLMHADFDPQTARAGAPRAIAQTRIVGAAMAGFQYDVAADGGFIINSTAGAAAPLTMITGWNPPRP